MEQNTALGATAKKEGKIIFISDAHEKFYYEKLKEVRYCKCQYKNVVFLSYKHVGKPTCLYDIFSYPQSYIASDPLVGTKVHLY